MGFFADLTQYAYIISRYTVQPDALNVGWLDYPHKFDKGQIPSDALKRLTELCAAPVNLCRGSHVCSFCHAERGNGEIRVTGDGVTYAAPVLIAHYVEAHNYQPPQAFIEALLSPNRPSPSADLLRR